MSDITIRKADKRNSKLRLAFIGLAGSGKTYSSLSVAKHLGGKVCLIDSEHSSSEKYANIFNFDVITLENDFSPQIYIKAIKAAQAAGYDVLIIDSLSHAWMGKLGALEQVSMAAKKSQSSSKFFAWREVTPVHNELVETIISANMHVIVTLRSKMDYVIEDEDGKKVPRKIGLAPVQREGLEYEFDVVGDLTLDCDYIISKTRCPALFAGIFNKPGEEFTSILKAWLVGSTAEPPKPKSQPQPPAESKASKPAAETKKAPPPSGKSSDNGQQKYIDEEAMAAIIKLAKASGFTSMTWKQSLEEQFHCKESKNMPIELVDKMKEFYGDKANAQEYLKRSVKA